jgi:predicted MPP superfamily phosphohydrolase
MLSGHTHGGQVYVEGLGTPTLSRRLRRYCAGLYQVESAQLYVNKGIGYSFRFRYNRRPEVAVLDLIGAEGHPAVAHRSGNGV